MPKDRSFEIACALAIVAATIGGFYIKDYFSSEPEEDEELQGEDFKSSDYEDVTPPESPTLSTGTKQKRAAFTNRNNALAQRLEQTRLEEARERRLLLQKSKTEKLQNFLKIDSTEDNDPIPTSSVKEKQKSIIRAKDEDVEKHETDKRIKLKAFLRTAENVPALTPESSENSPLMPASNTLPQGPTTIAERFHSAQEQQRQTEEMRVTELKKNRELMMRSSISRTSSTEDDYYPSNGRKQKENSISPIVLSSSLPNTNGSPITTPIKTAKFATLELNDGTPTPTHPLKVDSPNSQNSTRIPKFPLLEVPLPQ